MELKAVLQDVVPQIYADNIERLQLPMYSDMSRGNKCDRLTFDLHEALTSRGLPSRRELHKVADGRWHFVIAHAAVNAEPAATDLITDLTPWQVEMANRGSGFLHQDREAIMTTLQAAGAPEWFVSLRGIATIAERHTTRLTPFSR
ncbi:MAG: hypothetical protein QFB87_04930 [Patescibacteria group bacterium]|nr:hypothetical protein [Patescibacteria group bacterium]